MQKIMKHVRTVRVQAEFRNWYLLKKEKALLFASVVSVIVIIPSTVHDRREFSVLGGSQKWSVEVDCRENNKVWK
jgi:hypothetical protein